MKINIFQWHYSPLLMLGTLCLYSSNVSAYPLSLVDCDASILTNPINISNTITSANVSSAKINATLQYKCRSQIVGGYVSVCLAANGGNDNSTDINPRYMMNRTNNNSTLPFIIILPEGKVWGTGTNGGSEYQAPQLYVPGLFGGSRSGSVPINVSLVPNTDGTLPTAGLYSTVFSGLSATLTFDADTNQSDANCLTDRREKKPIETFTVQATVINSCEITTTSDVNLGLRSASETNITGSNSSAITVNCTNGGSYYIGLKPFNNSTTGAGVMSGTGGNLDKVPYQLRSTAGINGTIWGNTATSTTVGNGVADFGTGSNKSHTVFVTVPSADVKPDTYSDTITINVNY